MTKSHVSMTQHQCPVCCTVFDTGELLLDTRLRPVFDRHTLTGHSLCPDCVEKQNKGFIALVEATGTTLSSRTGRYLHIHSRLWGDVFVNAPLPPKGLALCAPQAFEAVCRMAGTSTDTTQ